MKSMILASWISSATTQWQDSHDELTHLDSVAGDGDLGVTIRAGAVEVAAAIDELDSESSVGQILKACGAAFARGNPSSFAALGSAGLLAAAKTAGEVLSIDREMALSCLESAASKISERGHALPGDRTVLDSLMPSIKALRAAPDGLEAGLKSMVEAASEGVQATTKMTPVRGRAAWVGERGRGFPDGGATAYLRLIEALLLCVPDSERVHPSP